MTSWRCADGWLQDQIWSYCSSMHTSWRHGQVSRLYHWQIPRCTCVQINPLGPWLNPDLVGISWIWRGEWMTCPFCVHSTRCMSSMTCFSPLFSRTSPTSSKKSLSPSKATVTNAVAFWTRQGLWEPGSPVPSNRQPPLVQMKYPCTFQSMTIDIVMIFFLHHFASWNE